MIYNKSSKENGFTLVEVLVAAAIFGTLMVAITGIFISALRVEKGVLSSKKVLGQISYAAEYMTRALRMAEKDQTGLCVRDVPLGSGIYANYESIVESEIIFKNALQDGDCQRFFLEDNQIKYETSPGVIVELTSSDIIVENLKFEISGETEGDDLQPFVTIYMEAYAEKSISKLKIQTSVSQRNLDINY
ncbi:MAG: prepilin-type N-terminal cleavage/methylation domain-containing protein [Patescibacteria group bacterium]|nr:prepilin-type N-terminal cleavage/methylation domain-containing protein [Patescibacteria group bacterium]